MADVLLGRTDGIEGFVRHVVLKRIKPEHARDQRFIRMFLDEARVAANLHHQHIVQVHDIGEAEGEYFFAMEYIHGEDVRTILSSASKTRAHVPLGYAIAIVSAAAAGLHYAHERRGADKRPLGIVHRDVSPSNIIVGYDGSIKVVDFGIATASKRQETRSGSLKGKISYMSPEQCKGTEVDRRSDVYSLGVVLYELATTTRLFKGDNDYLVMDQIVNGRVSPPQVRRPDLPHELATIIMRAISADAERRFFTADELRVALDQFANKTGLTASTSAIGGYLRKQFGERPEPWLELEAEGMYSFDDLQIEQSAPSNSWSDQAYPRGTGSAPRHGGAIGASGLLGNLASDNATFDGARLPSARLPTTPPPTDSKMGWETQQPAPAPRGFTPAKVAMICAPVILLLIVAIWKLAGTGDAPAAVAQPIAAIAPPPAPVVTPIPEPPRVAPEPSPVDPAQAADDLLAKSRAAAAAAAPRRAATGKVADAAPAAPSAPTAPAAKTKLPVTALPMASMEPPGLAAPAPPPAQVVQGSAAAPAPQVPSPVAALAVPLPQASVPTPQAPQVVAPTALDANRIAGEKDIVPDDNTQAEIGRAGLDKIIGSYKLCITADGNINTVTPIKSSGFPAYDTKIQTTIRGQWRYRPFMINGKATPVCTAVRFIYSQR